MNVSDPCWVSQSHRLKRWFATTTIMLLGFGFLPGISAANHFAGSGGIVGGFEIDGDFIHVGSTKDWDNIGGVQRVDDAGSPAADDIFTGGSKEQGPDGWAFNSSGSVPGKTDLTRLYYAAKLIPTSTAYLWLGFERLDVEGKGDVHVNFELNQDAGEITNSGGVSIPKRTGGDLLIVYDYNGGDKSTDAVNIELREWSGSALAGSWGSPISGAGLGDVNVTSTVTGTARPAAPPFGGGFVGNKRFGEVGLDLLSFFPTFFSSCRNFSTFWAKSRASGESFNAALKDKTPRRTIELNTCDANIQISPVAATNEVGTVHTLTGHVNTKAGSSFENAPAGTVIDFVKLSGPGTLSANSCETTGATGGCSVTLTSTSPGTTVVKAATDVDVGGSSLHRETNGSAGNSSPATKNWIDYRVIVTPPTATNAVGATHTFTANLQRDTGSGWVNFGAQTLTLSLDQGSTDSEFVQINGLASSGTSSSCTTLADGTCDVKINSTTPGEVGLTATFNTTLDSGIVTRSGSASKQYVRFRIDVTPARATNEVNTEHTFTVSLDIDAGDGFEDYATQTVTLSLTPGLTNAHFVFINGTTASGVSSSCITKLDGTCSVTISSSVPGSAQLVAQFETILDSGTVSVQKSADKDYVNFRLSVDPATSTNEVGATHTFTVSLDRDQGEGFADYSGQTVALMLSPGTSDAHFTLINGSAASGTSANCVTAASGTCTVKIVSSTAGLVTLQASWETTLDSGTVTRDASATKQYNDYRLTVTPPTSTNEVGTAHIFGVLLERDTGSGFEPYADQEVDLALAPGPTNAGFTQINAAPASGIGASCTTQSDGTCEVRISSSQPGPVTLDASWETTLDSGSVTRSDSAAKQYNDYDLQITPPSAVNEVNDAHDFVVFLTLDTGLGPKPYAGQTVSLTIDPGTSDAHFTLINGSSSSSSGTSAGCTTDLEGTCEVRIMASAFGTVTLSGTWGTTLDSGALVRTASAQKRYVDASVGITPNGVNEVGDPHEFTITVDVYPAGATPVSFDSIVPSVSPSPTAVMLSTCDTPVIVGNTATCTIVLNSSSSARFVVNARATLTIGGVTIERSTSGDSGPGGTGPATKDYVDASVAIGPEVAVNPAGTSHTFQITVTAAPAQAGVPEFLSILPVVNPVPDQGSVSTCETPTVLDNVATCSLTITSSLPRTFSADVTATVRVGNVTLTRTTLANAGPLGTGRAIKHFIDIDLTKSGATFAHVGDSVTYTMVATNPSEIALGGISLIDPICDNPATLVSGDLNDDNLLDVSESWTFECAHVIGVSDGDPVHNVATVVGSSAGSIVLATATWDVDVIHPAIVLVKTANPISGTPGDPVTFTYVVTNTGDTTLFSLSVDDDKLGHVGDIASMAAGSSLTLTKLTTLGSTGVTNIGTVRGVDILGKVVTANDDASVSVVLPAVIERSVLPAVIERSVLPQTGIDVLPLAAFSLVLIVLGGLCVRWGEPFLWQEVSGILRRTVDPDLEMQM